MHSRRDRSVHLPALLALLACAAGLLLAASPAAAETVMVERVFTAQGQSEFVVPQGVTEVEISAVGAPGSDGPHRLAAPGIGALVYGDLEVTPGETIYPEVDIGGGDPDGGGYSAVALCPMGTASCPAYSGLPWYLTEPLVAAGGGGAGEYPSIGVNARDTGGDGGLLGAAAGAGESDGGGGGGGASLTSSCAPGAAQTEGDEMPGTRGLPEGVGGGGGDGEYRGGGGGGGYIGGCGGGGGGGFTGGGGGGGGASFANNPALTDYLSAIPTITGYGTETPLSPTAEVAIDFEDSNVPAPTIRSPKNVQVGERPLFTGFVSHEADDDLQFTLEIEETSGNIPGSRPFRLEETGTAAADGSFAILNRPSLPSGTYQAQVTQSLIGGGNRKTGLHVDFTVDDTPPLLSLTSPPDGAYGTAPPASFDGIAGTEEKDERKVSIGILADTPTGPQHVTSVEGTPAADGEFSIPFGAPLPDGSYEAVADQSDDGLGLGIAEVGFTVDTTAPSISLRAPSGGGATPTLAGTAGTAPGDLPAVTVDVYRGPVAAGEPIQTLSTTSGAGGEFTTQASTLAPGTYTADASQLDRAANEGRGAAVTFTVPAPGEQSSQSSGEPHSSGSTGETHPSGSGAEAPRLAPPSIAILGAPKGTAGAVRLKLACGVGSSPCAVTLVGIAVQKSSGKKVTVAQRHLTIPAGGNETVVVPLDRPGRRLLGRLGRLRVRLDIAPAGGRPLVRAVVVHRSHG